MKWTALIGAVVALMVVFIQLGSVGGSARSLFGAEQVAPGVKGDGRLLPAVNARQVPGKKAGIRTTDVGSVTCPPGCTDGGCTDVTTGPYFACSQCKNNLLIDADTGRCACPPGTSGAANDRCADCDKGYFCLGGVYDNQNGAYTPQQTQCPLDKFSVPLTTMGKRSASRSKCVNLAGYFYKTTTNGGPDQEKCPVDTYGPGLKKQRSCIPCPSGFTTRTAEFDVWAWGKSLLSDCRVPGGYYQKNPGQVAPCPNGEFKPWPTDPNVGDNTPSCTKCTSRTACNPAGSCEGVTTEGQGSSSETDCNSLLPTFYAAQVDESDKLTLDGTNFVTVKVKSISWAAKCPFGYFCPGGKPTVKYDPTKPDTVDGITIVKCPNGLKTRFPGASSEAECLVPPGYSYSSMRAKKTLKCGSGEYRAEWKAPGGEIPCDKCGDGISSEALEEIPGATPGTTELVAASSDSCYINPGQGMYYSPVDQQFRAEYCNSGKNYGVNKQANGLAAHPCSDCLTGMQTVEPQEVIDKNPTPTLPTETYTFLLNNYPAYTGGGGYTDPRACLTMPGYGYNGRSAAKCAVGFFNPGYNYKPCTKCGYGLTTVADDSPKTRAEDCKVAVGYGRDSGSNTVALCSIGFYNDEVGGYTKNKIGDTWVYTRSLDSNPPSADALCRPCPDHLTTSHLGATKAADCDVCAAGWGGTDCGTQCGTSSTQNSDGTTPPATYGPPGRDKDAACITCPGMGLGFFFTYNGANNLFKPAVVARAGAASTGDCLAQFAQIVDTAWSLGSLPVGTNTKGMTLVDLSRVATDMFTGCVEDCRGDPNCQYFTFDYMAQTCYKRSPTPPTPTTGAWLAYKALLAPGPQDATAQKAIKATGLASGSYTFHPCTASTTPSDDTCTIPEAATEVRSDLTTASACMKACDMMGECAAVTLLPGQASGTFTCTLIKGDTRSAKFRRSMTKANVDKLTMQLPGCAGGNECGADPNAVCLPAPGAGFTCGCAAGYMLKDGVCEQSGVCESYTKVEVTAGNGNPGTLSAPDLGIGGLGTKIPLSNGQGLALDAAGNLWIAETGNRRLIVQNSQGFINRTFDISPFAPWDVTVDAAGTVWWSDYVYGLVQWLVPGGRPITGYGTISMGHGKAKALAVNPVTDQVYVSSPDYPGMYRLSRSATVELIVTLPVSAGPKCMAFSGTDLFYHGYPNDGLVHTDTVPSTLGSWTPSPSSVGISGSVTLTFDQAGNSFHTIGGSIVYRWNHKTNSQMVVIGTGAPGSAINPTNPGQTQLKNAAAIAVGRDGSVYVYDGGNYRVLKVSC